MIGADLGINTALYSKDTGIFVKCMYLFPNSYFIYNS